MITIEIPVSPHVNKFLNIMYGNNYILDTRSTLGKAIFVLLQKKVKLVKINPEVNNSIFKIKIPDIRTKLGGCYIHQNNINMISQYCDRYFRDILYMNTLIQSVHESENIKKGMRRVLEVFDISEEDIALDSLYRDFMRKRNEKPFANIYNVKKCKQK